MKSRRPSAPLVAVASSYPFSLNKLSSAASRCMHSRVLLVVMPFIYIRRASQGSVQNCSIHTAHKAPRRNQSSQATERSHLCPRHFRSILTSPPPHLRSILTTGKFH